MRKFYYKLTIVFMLTLFLPTLSYTKEMKWERTSGPDGAVVTDMLEYQDKLFITAGSYQVGGLFYYENDGMGWSQNFDIDHTTRLDAIGEHNGELFVATSNKGLYKSTNNGMSWFTNSNLLIRENNGVPMVGMISDLLSFGNEIYVGAAAGIFVSDDGGSTWVERNNGLKSKRVLSIESQGDNLFAAMNTDGVYKSTDGGMNWTEANNGIESHNRAVQKLFSAGDVILASNLRNTLISKDEGESWQLIGDIPGGSGSSAFASGNGFLFAYQMNKLYRSSDNGDSWEPIREFHFSVKALEMIYVDSKLYIGTSIFGVLVSDDDGETFNTMNSGLTNVTTTSLGLADGELFAGVHINDFGYIWKTSDRGNTWTELTEGIDGIGVTAIATKGATVFAGTNGAGTFRSVDGGLNWERIGLNTGSYISSLGTNEDYVFIGTEGFSQGAFRSSDDGETWEPLPEIVPKANITGIATSGSNVYISENNLEGVYKSTDNGDSWKKILDDDKHYLYLSVYDDNIYVFVLNEGILESTDGGETWDLVRELPIGVKVTALYADEERVYVGVEKEGLLYKHHGSDEWVVDPGLPVNITVTDIISDEDYCYITTTSSGVWRKEKEFVSSANDEINLNDNNIRVYPNPVNGTSTIELDNITGDISLSLFDNNGRQIITIFEGYIEGDNQIISFDISDSSPGVYNLILLNNGLYTSITKIIKVE